jgi:hypothetical protein
MPARFDCDTILSVELLREPETPVVYLFRSGFFSVPCGTDAGGLSGRVGDGIHGLVEYTGYVVQVREQTRFSFVVLLRGSAGG